MDNVTAKLDCWQIINMGRHKVAVGIIYGDKKGRFTDGKFIKTSPIKAQDLNGKFIKTVYSTYELGDPAPKKVEKGVDTLDHMY